MNVVEVPVGQLKPSSKSILSCKHCQKKFTKRWACRTQIPDFCSMKCYGLARRGKPATEAQIIGLSVGWKLSKLKHPSLGKRWKLTASQCLNISKGKRGIPLSVDHKRALSKSKKGNPITHFIKNKAAILQKISATLTGKPNFSQRGKNHHNWRGGITPVNAKIRNSLEMKEWRRRIFERDDYTCRVCGERGGNLRADHIRPFSLFPALRFSMENGRTICAFCDLKSDTYGGRALNHKPNADHPVQMAT